MPSQPKFLILADGDFQPMTSKTANSVIRYLPERVVGVVDRVAAGKNRAGGVRSLAGGRAAEARVGWARTRPGARSWCAGEDRGRGAGWGGPPRSAGRGGGFARRSRARPARSF